MITSTYTVTGMSCGHCVAAVTAEVGRLEGVTEIDADLATGAVTVTSEKRVDRSDLRRAIEEAGYVLSD
jgi:copper ion binding protein